MSENKKLLSVIHQVTDSQVVNYSKTSGDINPIHLDSSYAKNTQLGERIAHGMLIISFISDFMYKNFKELLFDFKLCLCVFPFFVCVWFNSENSDKLLDPVFPIRFMKNLLLYYNYYL